MSQGWLAGPEHGDQWCCADVVLVVAVLLPAVERQALVEVALPVEQAHAHHRHAEIAGRLAVIAGQDAQAARVDRHRVVQSEFGAEVRDRRPLSRDSCRANQVSPCIGLVRPCAP